MKSILCTLRIHKWPAYLLEEGHTYCLRCGRVGYVAMHSVTMAGTDQHTSDLRHMDSVIDAALASKENAE